MILDEAIKHAEEVAEFNDKKAFDFKQLKDYGNPKSTITSGANNCEKCAEEHRQLAEWLNDYKRLLEQEPKWDRLYSWLNDMRLGIAPDETVTDIDERNVRQAQVDLLDEIMEWMVEPQERSDDE